MKEFKNIKPEHIKGTGYWFWTREAFATLNCVVVMIVNDLTMADLWDIRVWFAIFIMVPCLYIITPIYGTYIKRKYVKNSINDNLVVEIHNKNNIAYFTILEMLSGESHGT